MNHSEVHSRMAEYLEGDLELDKRALFDAHIDRCEPCRQESIELRETVRVLRSLPDPEPPPFLVETVMRRIRDGESQTGFLDRLRDAVGALATPRVAVPASALFIGLLMASGFLDPTRLAIPLLQGGPAPSRSIVVQRDTAPERGGAAGVAGQPRRQLVLREAFGPGISTGRANQGALSRQVAAELDRSLLARSQSAPPVVGRAPRITINLPTNATFEAGRLAAAWPTVSTPGRGVPYRPGSARPGSARQGSALPRSATQVASSVSAQIQRQPMGVVQAASTEAGGSRLSPFGGYSGDVARLEQRDAELSSRLDRLIRLPIVYSAEFAKLTIAEQELWLAALAEHAREVGRSGEAVHRLRQAGDASGDRRAQELATALTAQLRLVEANQRPEIFSVAPAVDRQAR